MGGSFEDKIRYNLIKEVHLMLLVTNRFDILQTLASCSEKIWVRVVSKREMLNGIKSQKRISERRARKNFLLNMKKI